MDRQFEWIVSYTELAARLLKYKDISTMVPVMQTDIMFTRRKNLIIDTNYYSDSV